MKAKIGKQLIMAILVAISFSVVPASASADILVNNPGLSCTGAETSSAVCHEHATTNDPLTGCPTDTSVSTKGCGTGVLSKIVNIIAYIAGAAAIIMLIVGAIGYITSGSDVSVGSRIDDDVLNAKRTIINALVGLAIIVLSKTIITYVLTKVH